jgi:hypothetical protein
MTEITNPISEGRSSGFTDEFIDSIQSPSFKLNVYTPDSPMRQRSVSDVTSWTKDLASQYDYCLVLPAKNGELENRSIGYIKTLRKLSFDMFIYKGLNADDEVFLLINAPLDKLKAFADISNFALPLNSYVVAEKLYQKGIEINHMPEVVRYTPYEKIYGRFDRKVDYDLYWKPPDRHDPFSDIIRLKLCALILESRLDKTQGLKIRRYIKNQYWLACFPLHDRANSELLEKKMKQYPFQKLPLDDLKNYFGEKIGLFFGFLEHYTSFLLYPAIAGIPCQIAVYYLDDHSAPFLPIFSFLISLWAVSMLEVSEYSFTIYLYNNNNHHHLI